MKILNIFMFFFASFLVPRTEVVGDADRYVKAGSTVMLRCIIRGAIEPPSYIIWYHGSHQLLPDNKQGIRIEMAKNVGPNAVSLLGISDGTVNEVTAESTERQTIVSTPHVCNFFIFLVLLKSISIHRLVHWSSKRQRNVIRAITHAAHQIAHHRR